MQCGGKRFVADFGEGSHKKVTLIVIPRYISLQPTKGKAKEQKCVCELWIHVVLVGNIIKMQTTTIVCPFYCWWWSEQLEEYWINILNMSSFQYNFPEMLTNKVRILTLAARKKLTMIALALTLMMSTEQRDVHEYLMLTSISPLLVTKVIWKGT